MSWQPKYDVNFIDKEFIVSERSLGDYHSLNNSRKEIKSEKLKYLYNKNNIKKEFLKIGFDVPELYKYTTNKIQITDFDKDKFVAKPAHMSWSDNVFINNKNGVDKLNDCLSESTKREEPLMLRECERGIIIEEYIDVVYELKVFVLWGSPFIADLRKNENELNRIDFINKNNNYLNWDKEFSLIEKFAERIKIDFFRIDFLYDGEKLYASECAFMPSTILPEDLEGLIAEKWSKPYYKYYYPFLA